MENKLTREQVKAILDGAPQGADKKVVFNKLVEKGYKIEGYNDQPEEKSLTEKAISSVKENVQGAISGISNVKKDYEQKIQQERQKYDTGEQGLGASLANVIKGAGEATIQGVGQVAKGITGQAGDVVTGSLDVADQALLGGAGKETLSEAGKAMLNTSLGQRALSKLQSGIEVYNSWAKENPNLAKDFEGVVNIASIIPVAKGAKLGVEGAVLGTEKAVDLASGIAQKGIQATKQVVENTASKIAPVTSIIKDPVVNTAKNIGTNIASKAEEQKFIQALPVVEKQAYQSGIDLQDINKIKEIKDKSSVKKLVDIAENFALGKKGTDPAEFVGQSIVKPVKLVRKQLDVIGKQLGKVSKTLPVIDNVGDNVFKSLQKVPALSGIKVIDGKLDFTDTAFSSDFTKAGRDAIEKAFMEAQQKTSGVSAHKYRQELFDVLNGKKKSLTELNDTEEKALNAIREGLLKSIEDVSPDYKKLSKEYATKSRPVQNLEKLLKIADPNFTEDLQNMKGGLLARRLTSNSVSQVELKSLLNTLDKVTGTKTSQSTSDMMNALNVIGRYYDIAPKTSLKGITQEVNTNVLDIAGKALKSVAGQTQEVRQKALKKLLEDLSE
jgi:hypothetical protein